MVARGQSDEERVRLVLHDIRDSSSDVDLDSVSFRVVQINVVSNIDDDPTINGWVVLAGSQSKEREVEGMDTKADIGGHGVVRDVVDGVVGDELGVGRIGDGDQGELFSQSEHVVEDSSREGVRVEDGSVAEVEALDEDLGGQRAVNAGSSVSQVDRDGRVKEDVGLGIWLEASRDVHDVKSLRSRSVGDCGVSVGIDLDILDSDSCWEIAGREDGLVDGVGSGGDLEDAAHGANVGGQDPKGVGG